MLADGQQQLELLLQIGRCRLRFRIRHDPQRLGHGLTAGRQPHLIRPRWGARAAQVAAGEKRAFLDTGRVRVAHVPDKSIEPCLCGQHWRRRRSAVPLLEVGILLGCECPHELALGIRDLQFDFRRISRGLRTSLGLGHLGQLVIKNDPGGGIHASKGVCAGEVLVRIVQIAAAVDEIRIGRLEKRERGGSWRLQIGR